MKINYLFAFLICFIISCKDGAKQDSSTTDASTTEQPAADAQSTPNDLKQYGDYSSLFNSQDCKVITAEEISTTLGLVFIDMEAKNSCNFKTQFPNNRTWNLKIVRDGMKTSDILREIQSFKSDETGQLIMKISDTGDSYLCIQHSHGYLTIYNPNYSANVSIRYGSVGESRKFTKEERLENQAMAVKLANFLLKKHQK